MITYDSFANTLKQPKSYLLFYEYFIKPVVGHDIWQRNVNCEPNNLENYGTPMDHGFAHIVLVNNQDEWEERMRKKHTSIIFQHDPEDQLLDKQSLIDFIFEGVEFDENLNLLTSDAEIGSAKQEREELETLVRERARTNKRE